MKQSEECEMNNQVALLIIDVQIALFARKKIDGKAIYNEEQLLDNIRQLIAKARDSNTPIVYMQHIINNDPYMGEGEPLSEIHPLVKPNIHDTVIKKYLFSPLTDLDKVS
jgi:nicotinamidase-related amidase